MDLTAIRFVMPIPSKLSKLNIPYSRNRIMNQSNQIQMGDDQNVEECRTCGKIGTDVDVPYGYCDYQCRKCAEKDMNDFEQYQNSMGNLEPVFEKMKYISRKDLQVLRDEIDRMLQGDN